MIQLQTLKYLVKNKMRDAEVLLANDRFPASIYLAGYAVEIALKYKICKMLQFNEFPESRQELSVYIRQFNQNSFYALPSSISDIRNHDLGRLLIFSGIEYRVKNNLLKEWVIVNTWNPESRYRKVRVLKAGSESYIKSAKKIIKEII
jgi:hypothetical protein